jgi:pimeloyl-ACP methyl ester carboxylesterase
LLLADRIPGATLEILPGAGHAFFWEQPGEVVELLLEFCYGSGWKDDFTKPWTDPC